MQQKTMEQEIVAASPSTLASRRFLGGPGRTRTYNYTVMSGGFCQLNYRPIKKEYTKNPLNKELFCVLSHHPHHAQGRQDVLGQLHRGTGGFDFFLHLFRLGLGHALFHHLGGIFHQLFGIKKAQPCNGPDFFNNGHFLRAS